MASSEPDPADIIHQNWEVLVKKIDLKKTTLGDKLIQMGVMDSDQLNLIKEKNSELDQNRELLHFIQKRPMEVFFKFKRALELVGQQDLTEKWPTPPKEVEAKPPAATSSGSVELYTTSEKSQPLPCESPTNLTSEENAEQKEEESDINRKNTINKALEPQIFHIEQSGFSVTETLGSRWYPLLFTLSWLPMATALTIIEKDQSSPEARFMAFNTWMYVSYSLSMLGFFWTNFVPGFGRVGSLEEFSEHLSRGFTCFFGAEQTCQSASILGGLTILFGTLNNLCGNLLIKYAEGAVYSGIIQALVIPLATLFWSLFVPTPYFHWAPHFDIATVFVIVGLAIIVPSTVMYSYFSDGSVKT